MGASPKEADHLRSIVVTAAISCLFVANIFISCMISHELYGMHWYHMLCVSLLMLVVPYILVSSALIHVIYGKNFLCFDLDANPLHILFGWEQQNCCASSHACMKYLNCAIKLFAFLITIFWLPILNIFICHNDQYFNAISVQLGLVILNTINHVIILCIIPPQSILAMLSIISCRISIFYILLSIFIYTYGHLSRKISNYKKYRYIASLTICIELLLAFIMIYITFGVNYDNTHYQQYVFTVIGFVNYIYPNLPFKKSRLILNFAYNASQKWMLDFVLNGDVKEMYHRFYCYLHFLRHHHSSSIHCTDNEEHVALLVHANINDTADGQHVLHGAECIAMRHEFMKMDVTEQIPFIVSLINSNDDKASAVSIDDYGVYRIVYFVSSVAACIFPVFWLLIVFESTLVAGWMNLLIYGSILMYMGFMARVFHYFFKIKASPNLFLLLVKVNEIKANQSVDVQEREQIVNMYKQNKLMESIMQSLNHDVAMIVLPELLQYMDVF